MDGPRTLPTTVGNYQVSATTTADHDDLLTAFRQIVSAGEGYPQHPTDPVSAEDFDAYWLRPARGSYVARTDRGTFAGAYAVKPNGVGRAAHVGNAGYFVVEAERGNGLGEALVRDSFETARALGFDALQFNFVFESNPARALYERLGFELVGRVPRVIDGEDVCIYYRDL